jgi:hypothetical protein
MVYLPKRDWWIAAIVWIDSFLLIFAGVGVLALIWTSDRGEGPWPLPIVFLAIGCLLLWMYLATSYEITPTELVVRCGPFRKRIVLEGIIEVVLARRFYVGMEVGFAWSVDRVRIRSSRKAGRPALFTVAIAPRDPMQFLADLAAAAPGLTVQSDGTLRRATSNEVKDTETG